MAKNIFLNPRMLLKSSALSALAAALAMVAVPTDAFAQDGRGGGRWNGGGQSAQSQSSGGRGWGGGGQAAQSQGSGRSAESAGRTRGGNRGAEAGAVRSRGGDGAARNWQGNNGGNAGGWRNRAAQSGGQVAVPSQDGASQRWRGRTDGATANVPRTAQSERRREAGRQAWSNQQAAQQQSGVRNRTYSDPDRNRSYRQDGRRADNWRDNNRGSVRDNRYGNNGNWRNNDGRWNNGRWDNGSNRWSNNNDRRWNRDWRRDNRYDWYSYRNSNRHIYRLGRYYAPYRNYSYRRLSVGFYLDSMFFGSNYWIDDPFYYRLPPADGGYRWVRYYGDALLVDTYSGEVIDVIYDFFD